MKTPCVSRAVVVTPRRWYTHHGIYVGAGQVVHYEGLSSSLRRGRVAKVSLAEFAHGQPVRMHDEANVAYCGIEVVARACSRLGEDAYDNFRDSSAPTLMLVLLRAVLVGQTDRSLEESMNALFPGRVIELGESDATLVKQIQQALTSRGYGPFDEGIFNARMVSVVKLYQAQNVDAIGRALVADGEVGIYTWGSLFPAPAPTPASAPSTLMLQALAIAGTQEGQMEQPVGSNRGPMVDFYLRSVGINPSSGTPDDRYWCMAFVYWTFKTAGTSLSVANPLPETAGCVDHWNRSKNIPNAVRILAKNAYSNPSLIKPGLIFILDFGGGHGHTGIVEKLLPGGVLSTVEGNTDSTGSGNGIGVFRVTRRKLNDKSLLGFVDYSLS